MIPFTLDLEDKKEAIDRKLRWKLLEEKDGILNWAIEGCKLWQKDGLVMPQKVEEATTVYRWEQDIIGEFIAKECITQEQIDKVSSGILLAYPISIFKKRLSQFLGYQVNQKYLKAYMVERGFYDVNRQCRLFDGRKSRAYRGIALKDAIIKGKKRILEKPDAWKAFVEEYETRGQFKIELDEPTINLKNL